MKQSMIYHKVLGQGEIIKVINDKVAVRICNTVKYFSIYTFEEFFTGDLEEIRKELTMSIIEKERKIQLQQWMDFRCQVKNSLEIERRKINHKKASYRQTHCWKCQTHIESDNGICKKCKAIICPKCSACLCGCGWLFHRR